MTRVKWLASFVLAVTLVPVVAAKTHCPGNVASVPLRLLNGYLMIVLVSVNHSGPYQFLLDTGTQTTTVDPSLALELGLATQGAKVVEGVGFQASALSAQLDLLKVGSHVVVNQKVLLYGLHNFQPTGLNIRGVLGEDFLEHFDVLIDNAHSLLCLDDSPALRGSVKGPHIEMVTRDHAPNGAPRSRSLIVESRLLDANRPVRLWLDSGTNVPFLYDPSEYLAQKTSRNEPEKGIGASGQQREYAALPSQDVKIGPFELSKVTFFTFAGAPKDSAISEFDGLLTTGLFKRIFICHADHFVILEPR
jgi:Aspartyl protease